MMKRIFMKKKRIVFGACVFFLIAIFLLYKPILNGMAHYLVYPDKKQKSDYIILLGGERDGQRTRKAAELYKAGLAPKIIVSSGAQISWRTTESKEMVALLKQLGVPNEDIILEQKSRSTYENALYTRELLKGKTLHHKRITLVTDNWHTRRSIFIFRKAFMDSGIEVNSVASYSLEKVWLDNWWQDHESTQEILTEWARLVVYWIKY